MGKYKNIEKAMGLQENQQLAVDKNGSFYCNEPLAVALEEHLAKASQMALTAEANIEALNRANETISTLISEKENLSASLQEKNETIALLTDERIQFVTEAAQLKTKAKSTEIEMKKKDETIEALTAKNQEHEAEIEELSKCTSSTPVSAPTKVAEPEAGISDGEHHFYKAGMTAKEAREALNKRLRYLKSKL